MIRVLLAIAAFARLLVADTDDLSRWEQQIFEKQASEYYQLLLRMKAEEEDYKKLLAMEQWLDDNFMNTEGCITKCEEILTFSSELMEKYHDLEDIVQRLKYLRMHISDELSRLKQDDAHIPEGSEAEEEEAEDEDEESEESDHEDLVGDARIQREIIDRLTAEQDINNDE